jgi:hypothetical protein
LLIGRDWYELNRGSWMRRDAAKAAARSCPECWNRAPAPGAAGGSRCDSRRKSPGITFVGDHIGSDIELNRRIATPRPSGRLPNLARDLLAKLPQRIFNAADPGLMIEIEHAAHFAFLFAQLMRQRNLVQPVLAHGLVERQLG